MAEQNYPCLDAKFPLASHAYRQSVFKKVGMLLYLFLLPLGMSKIDADSFASTAQCANRSILKDLSREAGSLSKRGIDAKCRNVASWPMFRHPWWRDDVRGSQYLDGTFK
jgi:hypothetical protein